MRVLVSGGSGYVGSYLCPLLCNKGHEVAVIDRKGSSLHEVCPYDGDIATLVGFFEKWKPEAIIHLAADISKTISCGTLDNMLAANIVFPSHLLQASAEFGVKTFINISTFSTSINGIDYNPQTFYAATKKAAEDLAAYYAFHTSLDVCTLGFYDLYGAHQPYARFLNACLEAVRSGNEFHMSPGEQELCFLYVKDAADAIAYALMAERSRNQVHTYMVMGPEVFRLKEVPHECAKALGKPSPKVIHDVPYRAVEIMKVAPPAPKLPGWAPRYTLCQGLQDMEVL